MKHSILIIDDEVKLLERLKQLLSTGGYEITLAENGRKGLQALQKRHFDLVITDLVMPEGSGAGIMDYLKKHCPETLLIVITGHASVESAINALRTGAYDYLIKPFRAEVVKRAVKRACERIELQQRLKIATRQLQVMAITDPLTNAYNKRYFKERLSEEFERTKRYALPLSCIMIDLDNFKHINDTYGHLEGDRALKNVSRVIKQSIRSSDFLARYGGDEFVLLLPQTPMDRACLLAERIQQAIHHSIFSSHKHFNRLSTSLGIATLPHPEVREEDDLIALADKALYKAKRNGRNRIEISET